MIDRTSLDLAALSLGGPIAGLTEIDGGWLAPAGGVRIAHDLPTALFYRHGWNSWSPTGWSPLAESPLRIYNDPDRILTADDAANDRADVHEGSAVGALDLPDGRVLLLGALGLGTPRVGASSTELWGSSEPSGDEWLIAIDDEAEVFARYAALLAQRLGRPPAPPVQTMWCSWYSFFEDIDETRVVAAIRELGDLPFDVVQIDDGWETVVGDWNANAGFPSGMKRMARVIRDRGSRAGLWLAPFIALPRSHVVRDHPDWLVRDESGKPLVAGHNWESHYFALDTTHPDVQQHLRRAFAEVTGWGFEYLKLDFLYAGALPGRRHAATPRETAYRDAITLIRETVGPDVYLLGCGAPMIPSVGIFDGIRVGPDTASDWAAPETVADPSHEGGLTALTASLERLWMRDLFQVDPDVAFFRRHQTTLDDAQRQQLIDLALVAGFRSTSDPVDWLTEAERAELATFLATAPEITREVRYRYDIGGRAVDFSGAIREARAGRENLREVVEAVISGRSRGGHDRPERHSDDSS